MKKYQNSRNQETEAIQMEESNSPDVTAILHGTDRTAIKHLITKDSKGFCVCLDVLDLTQGLQWPFSVCLDVLK